ncbi:MAG: 30S ribosomal protein S6 [Pseudomonadota bacterium]|nr:30S ribosomal protein S6 [Pseudomonadota bacterium]
MQLSEIKITRPYEGIILMHPDSTADDQKALLKKNAQTIESHKGQVKHVDTWGKRFLATPIDKITKAHYFHTTFVADTKAVTELERTMRINEKVLRFFHKRLDDRVDIKKHVDDFKAGLAANAAKERESRMKDRRPPRAE